VHIPDTVIFRNHQVDSWYFMSREAEIRKKTKSKLNKEEIA
jgi:hypothetical protein